MIGSQLSLNFCLQVGFKTSERSMHELKVQTQIKALQQSYFCFKKAVNEHAAI